MIVSIYKVYSDAIAYTYIKSFGMASRKGQRNNNHYICICMRRVTEHLNVLQAQQNSE